MQSKSMTSALVLSAAVALPTLAVADGPSPSASAGALPAELQALVSGINLNQTPRRFPSVFGVPSAVGPAGNTGFVALTLTNPRQGISGEGWDGDASAGYTIGDAVDNVALTFGVNVASLEGFGDDGSFFLNASRQIAATGSNRTYLGLQAANLGAWGDADEDDEALTATLSHLTSISSAGGDIPVQFTVGFGEDNTVEDDGSGDSDDGVFLGVGFGISENFGASVSATETQLNLGVGFSVPSLPNVGFSAGVFDVTDNTERRQFSLTAAFSF